MSIAISARTSLLLVIGIAVALLIAGWLLWPARSVSTDDAFIESPVVPVASEVAGSAIRLAVKDNQLVAAGDLLVEIDPATWEARLAQAEAASRLATAERTEADADLVALRAAVDAAIAQAGSEVAAAEADILRAKAETDAAAGEEQRASAELARQMRLQESGVASAERVDQVKAAAVGATAALASARANITATEAQAAVARSRLEAAKARSSEVAASAARVARADAAIAQAAATAEEAAINRRRTRITAPVAGRVTRRGVEAGGWVQAGQTVLWLVPDEPWVVANFPESDLARIHAGQAVSISVDAYPGARFAGTVDSVQSGSGARFALLPAENATGNFVKVVQRVPVKITFDQRPDPAVYRLGPGMSAEPVVRLR